MMLRAGLGTADIEYPLVDVQNALNSELVRVVQEIMQPAHVSLWMRLETVHKGEQAD